MAARLRRPLTDTYRQRWCIAWSPLATVVIGGILSSTLLTLLVLPAVYGALGA